MENLSHQQMMQRSRPEILLCPPENGTKFRYFQINLCRRSTKEVMDQIAHDNFSQVGAVHTRVDTERHPVMHKTETIDYIILLKGNSFS